MATGGGQQEIVGQHHSWDPAEYEFDPYNLTAVHVSRAGSPSKADGCGAGPASAHEAAAAGGTEAPPVKRRPGRQRRTSVLCQVPGCTEELVDAKKYYRRYRICQRHCSVPALMIDGLRQRFCQQCGRFHDVAEFEGAKRSCKRKLKRHNERRRSALPATGPAPKKKGSDSWQSSSEGEEEGEQQQQQQQAAGQESSGSEPKAAPTRRQGTRRTLPRAAKAARAAKAPTQPGASDNSSAASQDTSSPSMGRRSADASPPAVASLAATPPAPAALSPSGLPQLQPAAAALRGAMPGEGRPLPPHQRGLSTSGSGSMDTSNEALATQPLLPQLRPAQTPSSQPGLALQCARSAPPPGSLPLAPQAAARAASAPEQPALGLAYGDLDDVLQHLLTDDELQAFHLGPLEPDLAPTPLARPPSALQPPGALGREGGGFDAMPLGLGLLDDLPFVPLPEEMRNNASGSAYSAHTGTPWHVASSSFN